MVVHSNLPAAIPERVFGEYAENVELLRAFTARYQHDGARARDIGRASGALNLGDSASERIRAEKGTLQRECVAEARLVQLIQHLLGGYVRARRSSIHVIMHMAMLMAMLVLMLHVVSES